MVVGRGTGTNTMVEKMEVVSTMVRRRKW